MLRSSCLARMSPPKHTLFTFRTKVRTVRLSFLATRYNFQSSSWLSKKPSCMKILLNVRMRPAAIALNYNVENIRNDVRQKIIIYEKSQFDSLVWGSLTLAPNTSPGSMHIPDLCFVLYHRPWQLLSSSFAVSYMRSS